MFINIGQLAYVMSYIKSFQKYLIIDWKKKKKIMPNIITKHQSAFTKNRLISDNILNAFETLHCMQSHKSSENGYMAMKLDMSKAYDRMEWCFLEDLIRRLRFNERWIGLIMVCIKIVSYSILVNGDTKWLIHPTRGIRQGDPLSPFLFLLCTEALHGLFSNAASSGEINGFSFCQRGLKLTHLLFANNSMLFCRSTIEECKKILNILEIYWSASGQKVNKNKTALFFSRSTMESVRLAIKHRLGLQEIAQYDKYLGLPSMVGKGKKESFNYIKVRISKKIARMGREVTITSRSWSLD